MNEPDQSPFTCTYNEFKERSASFFRRLKEDPRPTEEQINNGLKTLGLAYLHLADATEVQRHEAGVLLELATKYALYAAITFYPA